MKENIFICRASITFPELDAENPDRTVLFQKIYDHFADVATFWAADMYLDYVLEQPDGLEALINQYQRTDLIYLYRNIGHVSIIPHIAKFCEGLAGLLAIIYDADIRIDYPKSLPKLSPPLFEE